MLIDTNAVIDYRAGSMPEKAIEFVAELMDQGPCISIITQIELLSFQDTTSNMKLLNDFFRQATIYPLSEETAYLGAEIRKKYKLKLPDAVIAATTMATKKGLLTRNTADFKRIEGLLLVNPYEIK